MLNWINTYGKPEHSNHEKVVEKLKEGYYAIALMNKELWTTSGHFVVLWWQDGKVRINDPASTKATRVDGDIQIFRSQAPRNTTTALSHWLTGRLICFGRFTCFDEAQ